MAKTAGGIREYGRQGYALFDSQGEQVSRALFGNEQLMRSTNGRVQAQKILKLLRQSGIGSNYTIRRAISRY